MTCAIRAPEPYGCTDCLNTGWRDGAPAGFVDESLFKETREENKEMREALTDIAKSDDIENCLDPQRNKRIASATIAKSTGGSDGV